MNIQLLDNSGLDDKYFYKKDVLIHSILIPIIDKGTEDKNGLETFITLFSGRKDVDLLKEYPKELIKKLDRVYAKMVQDELIFTFKMILESDIKIVRLSFFFPCVVLSVFKDEILKCSPIVALELDRIDPAEWVKAQLN